MIGISGRRSQRIYDVLRERIRSGALAPGTRLPGQVRLADQFGVALMTVRQALAQLQSEGLISIEHGRGMFVRSQSVATVLIVDDDPMTCGLLADIVEMSGFRAASACEPQEALRLLESTDAIALVLTDVRMPTVNDGVAFMRTVRRKWPLLPIAAVTAYPQDLIQLKGDPECPVLVIHKPFHLNQIEEALRLALGPRAHTRQIAG